MADFKYNVSGGLSSINATWVPPSSYVNVSSTSDAPFDSNDSENYELLKQPIHMVVIYSLAYCVVFVSGIVGNSLVVSVVYKNPRMHSVTNYFIVNLAIADILVCCFCLPMTLLSNLFTGWRFGAVMCKATPFLQGVSVSASVNTLAAIAFDRYLAICHTLEFKLTARTARLIILAIWLIACIIMTPWAIYYKIIPYSSTLSMCDQVWPSPDMKRGFFLGAIFLTCYTIPLIFISVFYTLISCRVWNRNAPGVHPSSQVIHKSKVKVLKMMIVVVIFFAFSWLPLYTVHVRISFGPPVVPKSLEFYVLANIILPVAQWLGSSNSCVNPIIYCFFSDKFRRGFKDLCIHCTNPGKRTSYVRNNSVVYRSVYDNNGHSAYSSVRGHSPKGRKTIPLGNTFV